MKIVSTSGNGEKEEKGPNALPGKRKTPRYGKVHMRNTEGNFSCKYTSSADMTELQERESDARLTFDLAGMYLSVSGTDEDCKAVHSAWSRLTLEGFN